MPISGGTADKFGNRYEALWAVDQLLQIIDGTLRSLTLEPLDPDEARGVEFSVKTVNGITNYWSVKRQTTKAAGWTLAQLTAKDDRGRAILDDLLKHVGSDPKNHVTFASTLGAYDFEELRTYAKSTAVFEARLAQSRDLKAAFQKYLLPLFDGNIENVRAFLLRAQALAADESQLRDRLSFAIRKLFYQTDGSQLNAIAVRGYLIDLLLDNIHCPVDREIIVRVLETHGIRIRDWALDKSINERVNAICKAYTIPLRSDMINGSLLPVVDSQSILGAQGTLAQRKTLVVGGAGSGKSTVLAAVVEQLCAANVPVLPIRFDQLPEGILTVTELGRKLLLPESPTLVLAGIAEDSASVLVVDQLDAVSVASGRRSELWSLFEQLQREVEQFPHMSIVVGCREFDLEYDRRMRAMKAATSDFAVVLLKALSTEQVNKALRDAGTEPGVLQSTLRGILSTPLYLSMFLRLPPAVRIGLNNRDELFDNFWTEGEHRVSQRLGRKASWTQVIDKLADWLSENQRLSAPRYVLDDFAVDASAMASEHILVKADDQYRFFHESFFDYAFARRFAARGRKLLNLLLESEQHLFRRAQVRQILAYLRQHDWARYVIELEHVLSNAGVRFHIQSSVFQWLSSLSDPRREEWKVLQKVVGSKRDIWSHVRGVVTSNPGWFDVLDADGFFDAALSSGDAVREEEAVWILSLPNIVEVRSERITELLCRYRAPNERWNVYLRHVCRFGHVYQSPKIFAFFLSLIDDGTLDDVRPGVAMNDNWWTVLFSVADKRPDLACEAIGHWFDRVLAQWREEQSQGATAGNIESGGLRAHLDRTGHSVHVLKMAAKSPLDYARQMFSRVARLVEETAKVNAGYLSNDPIWSFRSYGDDAFQVHDGILSNLATSLESLAQTAPQELDQIVAPYCDRPCDTIAYLLLRAWTSAPQTYAEKTAAYLASDSRRLKIGYSFWSGGSAEIYVSAQAVRAASSLCSPERFTALEDAILSMKDKWEAQRPQVNGRKQLELLESLANSRLSPKGLTRLRELQRKFPAAKHDPPETGRDFTIGSPIPDDAQHKMSDDNWLRAMRKYAGRGHWTAPQNDMFGGGHELGISLQTRTTSDPARFAALASRMSDDMPANYFDAILRGVAEWVPIGNTPDAPFINVEQAASLVRRAHALPTRPCGRAIAWLVEKWKKQDWPDHVLDAVTWYAINDPDPNQESWKIQAGGGKAYYSGDPHTAGINSTRGAAAGAVAQLLFDSPERFSQLEEALNSLSHDRSVAVRSCAIVTLLAFLNIDAEKAIHWFKDCVATEPAILGTHYVERFVYFAGYRNYAAIRPVIKDMMNSSELGTVEAGARVLCLLSLSAEAVPGDAELLHNGTTVMRKAAVHIYARNVDHKDVGAACRLRLRPFFADEDESVRLEAASAFHHIHTLSSTDQAGLLSAFLDTGPGQEGLALVVHEFGDSPVQLPDLVCRLVRLSVEASKKTAGDIRTTGPVIATDLSKIVVRLYAQTEDPMILSECLALVDEMERHHFFGLSDELRKLDR